MPEVIKTNLPFRTVLVGEPDEHRAFVDGYADLAAAVSDAAKRNARAEELGVVARYEAVAKP
jgi:hypothetical protein